MSTPDAPLALTADNSELDAGLFTAWLKHTRQALRGEVGANVACGTCLGCCRSHYAILLRPTDAALDVVPAKYLSGAPGLAYPHARMIPQRDGRCPMLVSERCQIYAQRPQTCRDYDCRVFTAAGVTAGAGKTEINARIAAWRFSYEDAAAHEVQQAVQAAAQFMMDHQAACQAAGLALNTMAIAVTAIKVYGMFMAALPLTQSPELLAQRIAEEAKRFDSNDENQRA